jgi:diacylglycerol kinase family enzyme
MGLHAIINYSSGSVPQDAARLLDRELGNHSSSLQVSETDGSDMKKIVTDVSQSDAEAILVWGGDGTVTSIAEKLLGTKTPLLPLPGGTMNMLHERVHEDTTDWQSCLRALAQPDKAVALTPGTICSHYFFVATMFGQLVEMTAPREALRDGNPAKAIQHVMERDILALDSIIKTTLTTKDETEVRDKVTALAAFAPDTDEPVFEVGMIDPDNLLQLAETGLKAILTGWRNTDTIRHVKAKQVEISSSNGASIPFTVDGELRHHDGDITVGIADKSVAFLGTKALS